MGQLIRLIYVSRVSSTLDRHGQDETALLSKKFNPEEGITGLLLYSPKHWLEALEGEEGAVKALFTQRMKADSHHYSVHELGTYPIEERTFLHWQIGFIRYANLHGVPQGDLSHGTVEGPSFEEWADQSWESEDALNLVLKNMAKVNGWWVGRSYGI